MPPDFVLRVKDEGQGFVPGERVEILPALDGPGRSLQKAPHGPYRIIHCATVVVHGTVWWDLSLRRVRRA